MSGRIWGWVGNIASAEAERRVSRIHYAARALRAAIEADTRLGAGRETLA